MFRTRPRDEGFTLIEAAIALLIAAFIFIALGQTVATALRAAEDRRLEQQASALVSESMELVRNLTYDEVALLPSSLDPTRTGETSFDPGTGSEPVVEETMAGIPAQVTTEAFNTINYTLKRYVTWVDDNPLDSITDDYKRVTVEASWTSRGQLRTEQLETFVAEQSADAGASNPTYGAAFNPPFDEQFGADGTDVVFAHTITNIGNRDDYFEITVTNDEGWPVMVRDAVSGVPLADWTGEGTPDTGLLTPQPDPASTIDIEVVVSVPSGTPLGESSLTTVEATSFGDPSRSSSANDTTESTGSFMPTDVALFLKSGMALSPVAPTGFPSSVAGPNGTTFTWSTTVTTGWKAVSDGNLRLWVSRRGTCAADNVAYDVTVRSTSGTWATASSGDIAIAGCDPVLSEVELSIDGNTVLSGESLYIDITITKVAGGNPGRRGLSIAFDGVDFDSSLEFSAVAL